jgi:NADPH:quinone reductase-like Zn-dependent oxidoreductase
MKAVYIEKYGDSSVLKLKEDYIIPKISNKNDVLIKIYSASFNPIDYKMRSGSNFK